jgi:hypothetical protein
MYDLRARAEKDNRLMGIHSRLVHPIQYTPKRFQEVHIFPLDDFLQFHWYKVVYNVRYSRTLVSIAAAFLVDTKKIVVCLYR